MSTTVTHAETYNFVTKWGSYGSGNGQFSYESGVDLDSSDNIYVADTWNHRIQKFDSGGNYLTQWGFYGSGGGQFNQPAYIAVDPGNVTVADSYNNRVHKFETNGNFVAYIGDGQSAASCSPGSSEGQFNCPCGVAVDSSRNIYVADKYNNRIQKFFCNGDFIAYVGNSQSAASCSSGSGEGQFNYPMGIAVDSSDNIYVADTWNHRVQKFDSGGNYLTQWGSYGSSEGQFSYPVGIDIDSSGNVYVSEFENHRVQKFDSNGNFITYVSDPQSAASCSPGSGEGQLNHPNGIAVDSSGNVYVADQHNHRIQEFAKEKINPAPPISTIIVPIDPVPVSTSVESRIKCLKNYIT